MLSIPHSAQDSCKTQRTIQSQMSAVLRGRTELNLSLDLSVPQAQNSHLKEKKKKNLPVSVAVSITCNQNILTKLGGKTHAGGFGNGSCRCPAQVGFIPWGGVGGWIRSYTLIIFNTFRNLKLQGWYREFPSSGTHFVLTLTSSMSVERVINIL